MTTKTTIDNITDTQILALLAEAAQAGDEPTVHCCHVALGERAPGEGGQVWPTSKEQARAECAAMIAAAEAMADD